jgi:hypothetical protein
MVHRFRDAATLDDRGARWLLPSHTPRTIALDGGGERGFGRQLPLDCCPVTYGELFAFVATAIAYCCSLWMLNRAADDSPNRALWALPPNLLLFVLLAWAALLVVRTFGIPY